MGLRPASACHNQHMKPSLPNRLLLSAVVLSLVGSLIYWLSADNSAESSAPSALDTNVPPSPAPTATQQVSRPGETAYSGESSSVQKIQDHDAWLREIVAQLIMQDDGRSLVAAAAIMHAYAPLFRDAAAMRSEYAQNILELMNRATVSAPGDPVVAMIAEAYCLRTPALTCDSEPFDQALRASDADNALAWLGSFKRAKSQADPAQQAQILHKMANATRIDSRYLEIESLLLGVIESVRVPIPESATDDAVPVTRTVAANALRSIPKLSLAPLATICKRPVADDVRVSCLRLVELARDEQGNLPPVALGIAVQLSEPGTEEARTLVDAQRRREWRFLRAMRLPRSEEQTRLISGGDVDAAAQVLIASGESLDPPPDWSP